MPLDLRTKDELRAYAYHRWRMLHIASNYLDAVYDRLDSRLNREQKVQVLKRLIDWWSSPNYMESIKLDSSPERVLRVCIDFANSIQRELLDKVPRDDRSGERNSSG